MASKDAKIVALEVLDASSLLHADLLARLSQRAPARQQSANRNPGSVVRSGWHHDPTWQVRRALVVDLRDRLIETTRQLWDALAGPCGLPDWFGRNLNAWNDTPYGGVSARLVATTAKPTRPVRHGHPGRQAFIDVTHATGCVQVHLADRPAKQMIFRKPWGASGIKRSRSVAHQVSLGREPSCHCPVGKRSSASARSPPVPPT
jgi:hypothetical protein